MNRAPKARHSIKNISRILSDSMAAGQIQKFCLKILLWTVLILIATGINDRMLFISWPATKLSKENLGHLCRAFGARFFPHPESRPDGRA